MDDPIRRPLVVLALPPAGAQGLAVYAIVSRIVILLAALHLRSVRRSRHARSAA